MSNFNNSIIRDKGLDEIVGVYRGISKNITSRSKRRMNLPVYPVYNTYEEALISPNNGYIYAVRVSDPYSELIDFRFPVLYVKIPNLDRSVARKSYDVAIKNHYSPLRWVIRRREHINYQNHITCKLIK